MAETPNALEPSPWVVRFAARVRGGRMLDIACGSGRHAHLFAELGCRVAAVDIDPRCADAFRGRPEITFTCADLESGPWPYGTRQFDAIIVTNYLHRPLLPALPAALAPGGLLLYETFAAGQERFGRPCNPAYLLRSGELLEAFAPHLHVLAYEDGVVAEPQPARRQRIAALREPDADQLMLDGALDADAARRVATVESPSSNLQHPKRTP